MMKLQTDLIEQIAARLLAGMPAYQRAIVFILR